MGKNVFSVLRCEVEQREVPPLENVTGPPPTPGARNTFHGDFEHSFDRQTENITVKKKAWEKSQISQIFKQFFIDYHRVHI